MADQNQVEDAKRRYNQSAPDFARENAGASVEMNQTLDKVPKHEGEKKVTRSTEGSVEKTTETKK